MPGKVTVVLDTSASPLLVGVANGGQVVTARRTGIKQEKLLFPLLHTLLAKAATSLPQVTDIFIIRGPGRFTGIRIALTFASMMQLLGKCTVRGATLFEVLRVQALHTRAYQTWRKQNPHGTLAVVLHAFREEYFLQIFDDCHAGPQWLSREELLTRLAAFKTPLFITGTDKNFTPLTDLLSGIACTLAPYKACRVQARTLVQLSGQEEYRQQALEPLYLKPARFELERAQ